MERQRETEKESAELNDCQVEKKVREKCVFAIDIDRKSRQKIIEMVLYAKEINNKKKNIILKREIN